MKPVSHSFELHRGLLAVAARSTRRSLLPAALLVGAVAGAASAQTVRIVGSGFPYANIQAAVDAAADGDVVLVKSGSYSAFTIQNKSLTVIEDAGNSVVVEQAIVASLDATKFVALRGLEFRRPYTEGQAGIDLVLSFVKGGVFVEDCQFLTASSAGTGSSPAPAVLVAGDSTIPGWASLSRCTLAGSDGRSGTPGGVALQATGIRLALYDCALAGGRGGDGATGQNAGSGGPALFAYGAQVTLHGCSVLGGAGGTGGAPTIANPCPAGGAGGIGMWTVAGSWSSITNSAYFLASTPIGGAGGASGGVCSGGAAGAGLVNDGAWALTTHASGAPHSVELASPVDENTSTTATYRGSVQSQFILYGNGAPAFTLMLPSILGVCDLAALNYLDGGSMGGSTTLTRTYPLNNVTGGAQALVMYVQAGFADFVDNPPPSGYTMLWGAPSLLVVLNVTH